MRTLSLAAIAALGLALAGCMSGNQQTNAGADANMGGANMAGEGTAQTGSTADDDAAGGGTAQ